MSTTSSLAFPTPRRRSPGSRLIAMSPCVVGALVLLSLVAVIATNDSLAWYVISPFTEGGQRNLRFLLDGYGLTIKVSLLSIVGSMVLGLLIALPGMSANRCGRALNRGYVEIVRSVPVLVMLLWVYYGLPVLLDINLDVFYAGVIALAICDSPFQAEIFRAGIQSIDRGQHEAAESIGLGYVDKMRFVILPQAIRRVLPPLGNQFVYILKMSSLVSVIGMSELTRRANELVVSEYRTLEIYSLLVLEYLVLVMVASWLVRRLERAMGSDERTASR